MRYEQRRHPIVDINCVTRKLNYAGTDHKSIEDQIGDNENHRQAYRFAKSLHEDGAKHN